MIKNCCRVALALLIIFFTGCSLFYEEREPRGSGSLHIKVTEDSVRTLFASLPKVSRYYITFSGGPEAFFPVSADPDTGFAKVELPEGSWHLSVTAVQTTPEGEIIVAEGATETPVSVTGGSVSSVTVKVRPLQKGSSDLTVLFNWEGAVERGAGLVDQVQAVLNSLTGTSVTPGVTLTGNQAEVHASSLTSGYYTLVTTFKGRGKTLAVRVDSVHLYDALPLNTLVHMGDEYFNSRPQIVPEGFTSEIVDNQVLLNWNGNDPLVTSYIITRRAGNEVVTYTVAAPVTTFTDKEILPNTEYSYTVKGVNNFGESSESALVTAFLTSLQTGGTGRITVSDIYSSGMTLSWEKATDPQTHVSLLEYKVVTAPSSLDIDTAAEVEALPSSSVIREWTRDLSGLVISSLEQNTAYAFNVIVRNISGEMAVYTPEERTTTSLGNDLQKIMNELYRHIQFKEGDDENSITGDFILPLKINDVNITWTPGNNADKDILEIDDQGHAVILRPASDETDTFVYIDVVLTLSQGNETLSGSKTFKFLKEGPPSADIYYTDRDHNKGFLMDITGLKSTIGALGTTFSNTSHTLAVDVPSQKIYYDRGSTLYTANMDGSGETLLSDEGSAVLGLYYDPSDETLYWSNRNKSTLNKILQPQSQPVTVQEIIPASHGSYWPQAMTVDKVNNRIYWFLSSPVSIMSSDLDGNNVKVMADSSVTHGNQSDCYGMAVDPYENRLFWTDATNGNYSIRYINLNVPHPEVKILRVLKTSIGRPRGLTIDLKNKRLFYATHQDSGKDRIFEIDYNGKNRRAIIGSTSAYGLTVYNNLVQSPVPHMQAMIPVNGAIEVDLMRTVKLPFVNPLDPATINSHTVQVLDGVVPHRGEVNYDAATQTVSFTPTEMYRQGNTYTIRINGVKEAGGSVGSWIETTFTTLDYSRINAHWKFDGNGDDSSGKNRHISSLKKSSLDFSPHNKTQGSQSLRLTRLTDSEAPSNPGGVSMDLGDSFTVTAWVWLDDPVKPSINTILANCESKVETNGFKLYVNNWKSKADPTYNTGDRAVVIEAGNGTIGHKWSTDGGFIDTAGWYHLAFIIDKNSPDAAKRMRVFFNGKEAVFTKITAHNNESLPSGAVDERIWNFKTDGLFTLGYFIETTNKIEKYGFHGNIDDMRAYNRVLVDEEIVKIASQKY